ncbi:MAG: rhomboid family intramembrane serine protease, partial [Planctomycetota bacterium]|nr:rhomboid family intramembrane serine protease [Planctomycetota bacterium]
MFLPTSIDYPYMDRSWVTIAIVGLCVVLLFTHVLEHDLPAGVALDPADFAPHQLVTSIFFHVGPWHLMVNMLFLYVFGRYVEARLGHLKYAVA